MPARARARGHLLARYRRGEHVEVWRILREDGALEGDVREEALAVARKTMERVLANVEILSGRLDALGWRALGGRLHTPPAHEDAAVIAELERRAGPIPPSLLAFWEVVGGVDFVWDYRRGRPPDVGVRDIVEADPLCVDPPARIAYLFDEWDDREALGERVPLHVDLAPDDLHKADISGGAPYGVDLPFAGADPVWDDRLGLPFVDYLRHCFRWVGFARLEGRPGAEELVHRLGVGLIPF